MGIKERLTKKEKLIQKTINIDENLYDRLSELSGNIYEESTSKMINACIYELSKTEDIEIYDVRNEFLVQHTVILKESAFGELERLRKKYKIPLYKLVNIAIHNVIGELEQ